MRNIPWTIKHLNDHVWRLLRKLPAYGFRYGLSHTCAFLWSRTWFFLTRKVIPVWFPGGYLITNPQQLINHQSIFVERELWHEKLRTKNIKTYVDFGANVGQSMLFFKLELFGLRVAAVEPLASVYPEIAENLRTINPYSVYHCAISEQDKVSLSVCRDVGGLTASVAWWNDSEKVTVPGVLNIPGTYDLIKIDVDGSELIILNNLTTDQWNTVKAFVIECVPDQLDAITEIIFRHRSDLTRHKTGNIDYVWL